MTTSGTADFNPVTTEIITDALSLIGVTAVGETLTAEDYDHALRQLNMMLRYWSIKANLWVKEDVQFTLTPGTQSYTVGDGLDIATLRPSRLDMALANLSTSDIEMEVISKSEYNLIPNKTLQARALKVCYEAMRDSGTLWVWPTGVAGYTDITLTFKRPIQDFDDTDNNPDFPPEWQLAIVYNLAVNLAPHYLGAIPQDLASAAAQMLAVLMNNDEDQQPIQFGLRRN
jgi:hypothetical protein